MEKNHKQDVAPPIERENERDESYKSDNPQIDSSKTKCNYHMHSPDGSYNEFDMHPNIYLEPFYFFRLAYRQVCKLSVNARASGYYN